MEPTPVLFLPLTIFKNPFCYSNVLKNIGMIIFELRDLGKTLNIVLEQVERKFVLLSV
jgi:hypothetical protein